MALNPGDTTIDLSSYVRIGRYNLPEPTRTTAPSGSQLALEVSTVTYNPVTDTLFLLGDEGTSIVQVTKTGRLIDSMTLTAGDFDDPEGLTHVSGNQFVLVEERERQANLFTYVPDSTLSRADVQTVQLGTTIGNIGLEGISFDPQTGGYILVKETSPQGIFQTGIDFAAGTATNGSPTTENSINLFDPALANLSDLADVYALSNLPAPLTDDNLLILSQEDGVIVNLDRTGNIANSLAIATDPENPLSVADQGHEGLTVDSDGLLYVVSEQGGGDSNHPQLWVYAPATFVFPNAAPVEISLSNPTTSLAENSSTSAPIPVGTIIISDDALGTNTLSLTGADADAFEIVGSGLFLRAGTPLDFETQPSYAVTVNVDDASLGSTPDASTTFTLAITDTTDTPAALIISEVAPWSSGNSPGVAADWFEVTNTSTSAIDITGWRIDDDSASFANSSALGGVTSIAPGQSVIFVDGDANTINAFVNVWFGGTLPNGVAIGTYGGPGLGTGGDAVNLFDASGTLVAGVSFGASPGASPFASFDNAAGLPSVSTLSTVGANGAFSVIDVGVNEAVVLIGSPGSISVSPVPLTTLVGIAATDAAAAEEGQNPGTFTILRTGDTTAPLEVTYTIDGDAAAADYTPSLPTTLIIPPGASQSTITLTPVDDALAESTESVTLTLVDTANYEVAPNATSATVTIADNDSAIADFNLQVTEIWPGNSVGANLTADWFEIVNSGSEAWVSGLAPDLFYDDDSQDPAVADLISGITQIDPGESVVVVIGDAADAQTFASVWGSVIDLTGVDIGFTDGAGLGANGDGVSLFVGLPGIGSVPADFETYPAGSTGQSYDVDLAAFSVAGQNGAVATAVNDAGEAAVGSPGNGEPVNNIPLVAIATLDDSGTEASSDPVTFQITRTGDTTNALTVSYTVSGTAANGTDYTPNLSGTATIPAGASFVDLAIAPVDDTEIEGSETVILTLADTADYDLGATVSAMAAIADNDQLPQPGGSSPVVGTPGVDDLTGGMQFDGILDLLFVGGGNDTVNASPVTETIGTGPRNRIYGGTGTDELLAGTNDRLFGGSATDQLNSALGNGGNRLFGGAGDDLITVGSGDRAFGNDGNDTLDAMASTGGSRLYGNDGNDTFLLGTGDRTVGGDGDDLLMVGTGGGNLITGGTGADEFAIANGDIPNGVNTITDFEAGEDFISINGLGLSFLNVDLIPQNGDILVSIPGGDLAVLLDVNLNSLSAANFNFG